jgi:hypothetical protein
VTVSLVCTPAAVDSAEAERLVAAASGDFTPRVTAGFYYPYHRFLIRHSTKTLLGESALKVSCLVDARTGVASTTDPFQIQQVEVDDQELIGEVIDGAEARRIAVRYVAYVVRNKRRALAVPKTEVTERGVVHKLFWIVSCEDDSKPDFRVMVDAATGAFQVLGQ